nr:unnamed protein product [Spirometra erinaceieuropaei]
MADRAEEIQEYADRSESKDCFAALEIYGPPIKGTAPLLSSEGTILLTAKLQDLMRWTGHFGSIFNRSSTISNAVIDRLLQIEVDICLDLRQPLHKSSASRNNSSAGNHQASMRSQLKSTNPMANDWCIKSRRYYPILDLSVTENGCPPLASDRLSDDQILPPF